jgi:hypothetical protein
MADNISPTKRKKATPATAADILHAGRAIWARDDGHYVKESTVLTEDRKFREYFGCGPLVALTAWNLLEKTGNLPHKGTMEFYLWSLMCLKIYPKDNGAAKLSAADPKTFRRWVWDEFVPAIANLEPEVVSLYAHWW